jgi:uncharacterized membrane protein YhaH (DUF805 family)
MKCLACGYENIYGSTSCKQCSASLTAASEPVRVAPAAPVEAPVQYASPAPEPAPAPEAAPATSNINVPKEVVAADYPNELTFIPYIGNEQFNYFLRVLRRAFDFNTRSSRAEFWWFSLFQILIAVAIIIVLPVLSTLFSLIVLIPAISVAIRRLHDINKSGWWLLTIFIPLIGAILLLIFFIKPSDPASNQWGTIPVK